MLLRATAVLTMPIYTRVFDPADYGVWNFVLTVAGLLNGLLILGGDSAYARFFFEAKTERERQVLTSTMLAFLAAWSAGLVALCLPLSGRFSAWSFGTDRHALLFGLALVSAPLSLVNAMCGQALRNQFRARLFTALNVATALLTIGLGLAGVLVFRLGLAGVVGGGVVAAALMVPVRLWSVRGMLRAEFSGRALAAMLGYGVPLVPTSLAYWVFGSSDRVVLGKMSTLEQLGLYAVAASAVSLLAFVNGALGQAWSPHAVRIYEEQPELGPPFFGQMLTYVLVGFGTLCVGVTAFGRETLMVLSTPAFYPAALAVGPLALGFVAYATTQVTGLGITFAKKTKYFALFSWAAAVLNLGLNVLLVPRWGMVGSSWATAASYVFLTVSYMLTSQKLWPVAYEKRRTLGAAALTLAFTAGAPLLPEVGLLAGVLLKAAYSLAYVASLFALRVLDGREVGAAVGALRGLPRRPAATGGAA